jgi:hypothetical protein
MSSSVGSFAVTELFPLAKCTIRQSARFQQQVICSVPVLTSVPVKTNYLYLCFRRILEAMPRKQAFSGKQKKAQLLAKRERVQGMWVTVIRIRKKILADPDPLVRVTDPDPSIFKQK